jgi:hypothetical protein
MARGWESKSVEAQQEAAGASQAPQQSVSAEEAARRSKRHTLELSRARAKADLAAAHNPAHRAMLERALRALDDQLREAGAGPTR